MNEKQKAMIDLARTLIGVPYKYGAKPEDAPQYFDCSSFTQYAYKQIGIQLKRSAILQATQGVEISSINEALPGDLLFFRSSKGHYDDGLFPGREIYIGHVAIYTGNNIAIHAAGLNSPRGVIEENISEITKKRRTIVMIKRIL